MKKQNLVFILLLGIAVSYTSCKKKTLSDTENGTVKDEIVNADKNIPIAEDFIYYLDDKEVSKKVVDAYTNKSEEPFIIQTSKIEKKSGIRQRVIYAYTTKEGYIAYGEKHNINLKAQLEFEEHMRNYAEKSGAIAEYEKNGKVPVSYTKYENEYYNKIFGETPKANSISFYNNLNGYGTPLVMFSQFAVMPYPYNNNIESYLVGGLLHYRFSIYDKSFYRRRIETFDDDVYFSALENMPYWAVNRTTSAFKWW